MDETRARALLTRIVDEAPPASPVDPDRVIERVEAYRHRRTRWTIATAAALVLVVVVATAALATGDHDEAQRVTPAARPSGVPSPSGSTGPPDVGTLPPTAPAQFDPAHSDIRVTGVPDSLDDRGTTLSPTYLGYYAVGRDPKTRKQSHLQVLVGPRGRTLTNHLKSASHSGTDGPAIGGRPSTWTAIGDFGFELRWDWAPNAEAYVVVPKLPDPRNLAVRIASSLSIDLSTATRLPYTFEAPEHFTLREFQTTTSPTGIRAPSATVAYGGPGPSYVSINANPIGNGIGTATTTIEDRPARVVDERSMTELTSVVMATGDLKVTASCSYRQNAEFTAAQLKAQCLELAATVQQSADLENQAEWPPFAPR
ncbi:hypothetical protein [Cryptosporangium aurantiacum]|uniref:Uncharacterized protein n=1 Tax=Cryptosporangium aurantiacum TaxID=134849 RepID=A0A1M7RBA1_9ACTN|nr:hypothetical protein [Cryptosporangium aurantiacum]SHN43412.1 hypothetical protein SAMN05443668_109155 [Cryptosporangium aurantiacum]